MVNTIFNNVGFDHIQGGYIPPDGFEFYIRTAERLVGPIAWTRMGFAQFTQATKVEGQDQLVTMIVQNDRVVAFFPQQGRVK